MLLESIYRDQKPHPHTPTSYTVIWNGRMERAGACPSLLEIGRGPSVQSFYGSSQLAHAATYGMPARNGLLTL